MKGLIRSHIYSLFPAYLNGTLGFVARLACALWLRIDSAAPSELKMVDRLRQGTMTQASHAVPPSALTSIQKRIRSAPQSADKRPDINAGRRRRSRLAWAIPIILAVLALGAVLYAMPPAILLEWSVVGEQPKEFRVYRARAGGDGESGTAEFEFLNQIPAGDLGQPYSFADIQLLPGQRYVYRVEALGTNGRIVKSNTTIGDSISALPGQLALLAVVLVLICGFYVFAGHWSVTAATGGQGMVL